MAQKRRTEGGRVTRPEDVRPAPELKSVGHKLWVRVVAGLAVAMMILTLAVGIISVLFG